MSPSRSTTDRTHGDDGVVTMSELDRRERSFLDSQTIASRCSLDGCSFTFTGRADEGREALRLHREAEHAGVIETRKQEEARRGREDAKRQAERAALASQDSALEALARMDAGERQRLERVPETSDSSPSDEEPNSEVRTGRPHKWTPESVIAGIRAFYDEHGHVPSQKEAMALYFAGKRKFGTFGAAVIAAGFERRKNVWEPKPLDAGEPGAVTPPAATEVTPPVSDHAAAAVADVVVSPASSPPASQELVQVAPEPIEAPGGVLVLGDLETERLVALDAAVGAELRERHDWLEHEIDMLGLELRLVAEALTRRKEIASA